MAKRQQEDSVIDLTEDDDDNGHKQTAIGAIKKVKLEHQSLRTPGKNTTDEDDVEVVSPTAPVIVPPSVTKGPPTSDDEEVLLIGATNIQKLPHLRQHCPEHAFDKTTPAGQYCQCYTASTIATNSKSCEMCYCYACDAPAKECQQWQSLDRVVLHSNHCCSNDAVPVWVQRRKLAVKARQDLEKEAQVENPTTPAPRGLVPQPPRAAPPLAPTRDRKIPRIAPAIRTFSPYASRHTTPTANPGEEFSPAAHLYPWSPAANRYDLTPGSLRHSNPMNAVARALGPDGYPIVDIPLNDLLASGEYHLREHCTKHIFQQGELQGTSKGYRLNFTCIANNMEYCQLCFCFVCDIPASKCKLWRKTGKYLLSSNHCCAHQGDTLWVVERAKVSPGKPLKIDNMGPVIAKGDGPFAPDLEVASKDISLTKCRKCGWYSRFEHLNFQMPAKPTGTHDWCHKCGRVASEKDFGKTQAKRYNPSKKDFFLGEKIIPFRLKAHDPRHFPEFMQGWHDEKDNWTYSEAEMELDLFRHRFGERPTLQMIMASIPVFKKIPESGFVRSIPTEKNRKHAATETEAMILEQHSHKALLRLLYAFGSVAIQRDPPQHRSSMLLNGDIFATFNKESRCGNLTVRLYLPKQAFKANNADDCGPCTNYSDVLGNWYDIFPFSLPSLSRGLRAAGDKNTVSQVEWSAIKRLNVATHKFRKGLSMESSSGSKILGGVCSDDKTLKGCLKRFKSETLVQECYHAITPCINLAIKWSDQCWKEAGSRVSLHRVINDASTNSEVISHRGTLDRLESFLTTQDSVLASNLQVDFSKIINKTRTMQGLLEHLENVGHEAIPYVEGLKVELLEFQKQALQWAVTRERSPEGIQCYWWAKLPPTHSLTAEIYFNPIIQRFRKGKPSVVKGGFIAQQMGLGKTVLSLALILYNPAPAAPTSGSAISSLNDAPTESKNGATGWNEKLYSQTSELCPKRGCILSRGTLVVCPISLVGQWIEEAQSKLKDPGLVYPYHGGNRNRDPMVLAKNMIVVTTYQVIASDATYHAQKASSAEYVPPLEQIRWWRIICDESHQMKMGNTKRSFAMMNLVADHKWLVSGTPFNNSFNDLRNQLNFLGIENVKDMMDEFELSTYHHTGDPAKNNKSWARKDKNCFGHFLFFLRSIMIRHTQQQRYRGTSTTLMSLPTKTERTLEISFSPEENQHYAGLEEVARSFYESFKAENGGQLSRHYFLLTQKLTQARVASAGGRYPLGSECSEDEMEVMEEGLERTEKPRKVTRYSDFAFESKLKALIKDLLTARDEDPSSKSLVFSQYNSTLDWLQEELPKFGFQFRTLTGCMSMKQRAKALRDFQADPPTTIFLLSMRSGAVGINLTQANRVYLMEPSFNPALEQQAIGRVHRLGQKRPCLITRLVMKDSVEGRILKLRKKKQANGTERGDMDMKPKATPGPKVLIGSMTTDKATILGHDFDLLFGVKRLVNTKLEDAGASLDCPVSQGCPTQESRWCI